MLHAKQPCTFVAFIIIINLQACSSIDFRQSYNAGDNYIHNDTSINPQNFPLNVSTKYVTNVPVFRFTGKKWKVGRVSRQQYEIINMVWRRTNIFADVETTPLEYVSTEKATNKRHTTTQKSDYFISAQQTCNREIKSAAITQSSTESFIEFYYLDENMDSITAKPENKFREKSKTTVKASGRLGQFKNFVSRSPLFAFRINEPAYKRFSNKPNNLESTTSQYLLQTKPKLGMKVTSNSDFLQKFLVRNISPRYVRPSSHTPETETAPTTKPTTSEAPSDRVKFFEIYDSDTRVTVNVNATNSYQDNEIIREEEKIELEQVDINIVHGPNNVRYAKKHVKNRDIDQNLTQHVKSSIKINKPIEASLTSQVTQTVKPVTNTSTATATWEYLFHYTSRTLITTIWPMYPFAAVYVYERYQVHCDAAAISPYWLISSAACISRHREDPDGERSAFIAYCGENWRYPERIAYVKYTLVHPRYHPKDTVRKHLYNIGVIQVSSSMSSSCPGWAPVSIMSHQYVTEPSGSLGTAVGWGLNRYDTSYASRDLPTHPLSVYESFIYTSDCPGNSDYRNTKRVSEQAAANVYCLGLPAYSGEDTDPVHGGLLFIGGKLIALYLQEERRRWGDQSAQYTGVWRLVPWVLDVAKDPEELDFSLDR